MLMDGKELAKDIKRDLTTGNRSTIIPAEYEEKWISLLKKIIELSKNS